MPRARRTASALVAALIVVLALVLAGVAFAQADTPRAGTADGSTSVTEAIFLDYSFDRQINGDWTASDLQAAIAVAKRQGAGFEEFQQAVQDVYDREFLGLHTGDGDGATPQPSTDDTSGLLPEPRGPGERDQPPWPFLAMTAMAAALVLTGAGSSIYRRVHR